MIDVATTDCFVLLQDPPAKMKMYLDIDLREPIQPINQNLLSNNLQVVGLSIHKNRNPRFL